MNSLLPFIVAGVTAGSVYALAGVGLVLTFKTSGVFNFAHGALATVSAFLFYTLHVTHGMPWPIAALICFVGLGTVCGFGFETFARGLSQVSIAWRIASTVGILLSIQGLCIIIYGSSSRSFPSFLPTSEFRVGGVFVTYEELIIVLVSFLATGGLYAVFRLSRVGIAMRAVVESPELLAMAGTNPRAVRRSAWVIGCSFATLSGILIAPSVSLDPYALTLLVLQAFGAAAIGNFSSLPMTWVGGIGIGLAGSIATKYGENHQIISGLPPSLPFIILFLVLLLSPLSRLGIRQPARSIRPIAWQAPGRLQLVFAVAVVAALALVPDLVGYRLASYTLMLTAVLLMMSLGLLVRIAGQISLCQVSFAAIGAAAFSKFAVEHHVPWLIALILAGLVTVPIGALLATPAVRFSGLYLALATLGFGLLLQDMFYSSSVMFGLSGEAIAMPRPHLSSLHLDSERGFYYVVLVITVVIGIGTVVLSRTRLGRLLRGIADSPTVMVATGNGVRVPLVLVFCLSAFVAGVAGALHGMVYEQVSGANFDPFQSLIYLTVVLISIGSEPWYALVGGASLLLIPLYVTSSQTTSYLQLAFGVIAVGIALGGQPELPGVHSLRRFLDRFGRQSAAARIAMSPGPPEHDVAAKPVPAGGAREPFELKAESISVRFGGLVAVREMDIVARSGLITGLIGPNGAGKSTMLNACSGIVNAVHGRVLINGTNVSRLGTAGRARLGIGRSFQHLELCDSLSVWDNVAVGAESAVARGNVVRQVSGRRGDWAFVLESTERAIRRCGLASVADSQVGALSSSERRFVEIARCLAGPYRMLLLDEPSSGLDAAATARLGELLRSVVTEDGLGLLLVEHDMSLVMSICDDIYVMDYGTLLFHGNATEVQGSAEVRAAYLGVSDVGDPLEARQLEQEGSRQS